MGGPHASLNTRFWQDRGGQTTSATHLHSEEQHHEERHVERVVEVHLAHIVARVAVVEAEQPAESQARAEPLRLARGRHLRGAALFAAPMSSN